MSDLIESLYSKFILRDILAKAIPGLFTLLALGLLTDSLEPIWNWTSSIEIQIWVFYTIIYGLSFLVGMMLSFVSSWFRYLLGKLLFWKSGNLRNWEKKLDGLIEFLGNLRHRSDRNDLIRQRERFVILKDMTGNFAVSLAILFYALNYKFPKIINDNLVVIILIVGLLMIQSIYHEMDLEKWAEGTKRFW